MVLTVLRSLRKCQVLCSLELEAVLLFRQGPQGASRIWAPSRAAGSEECRGAPRTGSGPCPRSHSTSPPRRANCRKDTFPPAALPPSTPITTAVTYDLLRAQSQPFPHSPLLSPLSGLQSRGHAVPHGSLWALGLHSQFLPGLLPEYLIVFVTPLFPCKMGLPGFRQLCFPHPLFILLSPKI